jgi:hypothetical protein
MGYNFLPALKKLRKIHSGLEGLYAWDIEDLVYDSILGQIYLSVTECFDLSKLSKLFWYNKPEGLSYEIIFWEKESGN